MIFSFGLDRYSDLKFTDRDEAQVVCRVLAANGYHLYYCRHKEGDMYARFAKTKSGPATTPGYQSTRVLEGRAWNGQSFARLCHYRNDARYGGTIKVGEVAATPDHHMDIGCMLYLDDAEMLDRVDEEDD